MRTLLIPHDGGDGGGFMSEERMSLQKIKEMGEGQKEQLLGNIEGEAHDNEVLYWGCSQAVLGALQRHLRLDNGGAFRAASALVGGIVGRQETCGALLGGVMAIGLVYGRAHFEPGKISREQPEFVEALTRSRRFYERFRDTFGYLRCSDVRAAVRGPDAKEYTRFDTIEAIEDHAKCGDITGPAARLAAEVILQPTELFAPEINAILEEIAHVRKRHKT